MKKTHIILLTSLFFACSDKEVAPEPVRTVIPEFYLTEDHQTPQIQTVLNFIQGINGPRDLDFKPDRNELWVMNKGTNGSDFIIVQQAGTDQQNVIKRKDSHSSHFVVNGTAMAFSDINTFATSPEILNTVNDTTTTFMGPALWSGDLSIFANIYQSNWAPGQPLGSHLDMLHQSPYSMGIAHDQGNTFFVLDGHNGDLCRYLFNGDHGPGAEFHADGKIYRYPEVNFQRVADIPSHMVKDPETGILYYSNTANGTVTAVDLIDARQSKALTAPNEVLSGYWEMNGADIRTVAEGLQQPSGIAISENRLFVSDFATGKIHVYDLHTNEQLGVLETGEEGITGLVVSASGRLWFVNYKTNKLCQVIPK